jgi:hypothetical protein
MPLFLPMIIATIWGAWWMHVTTGVDTTADLFKHKEAEWARD